MRRTILALLLLIVTGWATPSRAQWWGGERPGPGSCGPWACPGGGWAGPRRVFLIPVGRPWAGPGAFGPRRFGGLGWGWRRWAWQGWGWQRWAWQRWAWQHWAWRREMRLRRAENWRRWVEASERPAPIEARPHRSYARRWMRPLDSLPEVASRGVALRREPALRPRDDLRPPRDERPAPAEAAVAMMPAAAAHLARPKTHAPVPSRMLTALTAAAMIRRPAVPAPRLAPAPPAAPAVLRVPEPPVRPAGASLRRPHRDAGAERRAPQPVVLRSQPARVVAPADPAVAAPGPAPAPAPAAATPASPADVPVAPLD